MDRKQQAKATYEAAARAGTSLLEMGNRIGVSAALLSEGKISLHYVANDLRIDYATVEEYGKY